MIDPSNAPQSFQEELLRVGVGQLQRGVLDRDLYVHFDEPGEGLRVTYVRLDGSTVTAFVEFASCKPIERTPCFAVGYAVPEKYRNQGRAKEALNAALSEMQRGFGRIGAFYVEAIVGADNKASKRVAEQIICGTPEAITDEISGFPAFRYVRRIEYPNG
jgi:RimJ/RimL family protein N-acetyltransferase